MLTLTPPGHSDAVPVTACAFVGPATDLGADVRSVLVRSDGSVSRSPSASGTAAVSVVLAAMGLLTPGAVCRHESLSGTSWTAEATPSPHDPAALTTVAVTAEVHATGAHEFVLEPGRPADARRAVAVTERQITVTNGADFLDRLKTRCLYSAHDRGRG